MVCGGGARPAQEELAVAAAGAAPGRQQAVRKDLAPLAVTAKVTAQLLCAGELVPGSRIHTHALPGINTRAPVLAPAVRGTPGGAHRRAAAVTGVSRAFPSWNRFHID
jgi:hypothetical protein